MASATDNFSLPLYDTGDAANLRDQYNSAMGIIDGEMKKSIDNTTTAINTANSAKSEATAAQSTADDAVSRLSALGVTDTDTASTSKTRWDGAAALASTNEDDIAAIDANLNALHANSVANASELWGTVTLNDKFNRGQRYKALFMGDSITEGYGATATSKRWSTILCNMIGLQECNVAIGGTTWKSIRDAQYNNSVTQITDPENVKYVFAFSGINAYNDTGTAEAGFAATALEKILARYENAIVFVGGISLTNGYNKSSLYRHTGLFKTVEKELMKKNYERVVFVHPWEWFYGCDSSVTIGDGLHPNDVGYAMIASGMYSAVVNGVEPENCFIDSNGLVNFSFDYSESGGPLNGTLNLKYSTNKAGIFFKLTGSNIYSSEGLYHGSASIPTRIASLVNIEPAGFTVFPTVIKGGKQYTPSQSVYNDNNYFKFYSDDASAFRVDYYCKYGEADKVTFDLTVFIPFSI